MIDARVIDARVNTLTSRRTILHVLASLGLLAACTASVHAQGTVLASTFDPSSTFPNAYGIAVMNTFEGQQGFAVPFTIGHGNYTLDRVDTAFFSFLNPGASVANPNLLDLSVQTAGSDGLPSGQSVETFHFAATSRLDPATLSFDSTLHPLLLSGQKYWLVAQAGDELPSGKGPDTGGTAFGWVESSPATVGVYAYDYGKRDGGQYYGLYGTLPDYRITGSVAAVPETNTLVSFGSPLVLGGLVVIVRKRKAVTGS